MEMLSKCPVKHRKNRTLHNTLALDVYSRVRKDYTPLHVYLGCVWVVIYVKCITYECLLHNTLALDVDTVQEACIQHTRV